MTERVRDLPPTSEPFTRCGYTCRYTLPDARVFDDAMLTRCEEIMRDVCADFGADLKEFNGETDHVHLLVEYPPKVAVSGLVNSLKGVSARYLRREFTGAMNRAIMHGHLWSPSYFAASCGGAPLSIVRQYVEQQCRPERMG